jgi:hypothetical protein
MADDAISSAIAAIEANTQPDVDFLFEMFAGAPTRTAKRLVSDLVAAANKREGAPRALLLAMMWRGFACAHAAWSDAILGFAVELGATAKQLAKQGAVIIAAMTDEGIEAKLGVVDKILGEIESRRTTPGTRDALLVINSALIAAAAERPALMRTPHLDVLAELINELLVVIARHPEASDRALGELFFIKEPAKLTAAIETAFKTAVHAWSDDTLRGVLQSVVRATAKRNAGANKRRDEVLSRALPIAVGRGFVGGSPEVTQFLAALNIRPEMTLPNRLPRTLSEALAFREPFAAAALAPPASVPSDLALPAGLVELYAYCDGFGDIARLADLAALQPRFAHELQLAVDDPEEPISDKEIDIRSFLPASALVAIGTDPGGDTLFIDPRREGETVFRYVHDESCVVRVEAPSISAYVALTILGEWARRNGQQAAFSKLAAREQEL